MLETKHIYDNNNAHINDFIIINYIVSTLIYIYNIKNYTVMS